MIILKHPLRGSGANSIFSTITSAAEAEAALVIMWRWCSWRNSGGGGNGGYSKDGGTGNDPPVSPAQGN